MLVLALCYLDADLFYIPPLFRTLHCAAPHWQWCRVRSIKPATGKVVVHVCPSTHMDPGWFQTADQLYEDLFKETITNVSAALLANSNRTFLAEITVVWAMFVGETGEAGRAALSKLVAENRLEFAGGGWVQPVRHPPLPTPSLPKEKKKSCKHCAFCVSSCYARRRPWRSVFFCINSVSTCMKAAAAAGGWVGGWAVGSLHFLLLLLFPDTALHRTHATTPWLLRARRTRQSHASRT